MGAVPYEYRLRKLPEFAGKNMREDRALDGQNEVAALRCQFPGKPNIACIEKKSRDGDVLLR